MKILKFGGTSVGSAEKIIAVRDIIQSVDDEVIVVVSAMQGVTNSLIRSAQLAASGDERYKDVLSQIILKHHEVVDTLYNKNTKDEVRKQVDVHLVQLQKYLQGVFMICDLTPKILDRIQGYGEILSALIISKIVDGAELIDSTELIITDSSFGKAKVNFEPTNRKITERFQHPGAVSIVPGFNAKSSSGEITTLGRGGSDYTASLFAAALKVDSLEIWTDVDGFMTADPKKVSKALPIENLSYAEAMELSHFGAKVIYTPTLQPAYKSSIAIYIRNTMNPSAQGTIISNSPTSSGKSLIRGISSIDNVDLVTIQGPGMVGVKGISKRLFGALAHRGINIILITQASSEYSISFAINPNDTDNAINSIREDFEIEIDIRKEMSVRVEKELSVIAIVGEQMKNTPGIAANLFNSLARNGISAIAIAQGSSELNISVVIKKDSLVKALNVIHEGFFLSHYKTLHLYLVGVGNVGRSLLGQIRAQQKKLLETHGLNIRIVGICRSNKMLINHDGIQLSDCIENLEKYGKPANIRAFIDRARDENRRNSILIDCTANVAVAKTYKQALDAYISVVTANKIACSSAYPHYKLLKDTARSKNVKFFYETNVGAGLPIINTINDLIKSGDKVIRLEAVLSGTLNFIFNELSEEMPMSRVIRKAMDEGYSEPDPRIDLSGVDVARKLVILARETGVDLEIEDVQISPFLPAECFKGSLEEFWNIIPRFDKSFEQKRKAIEMQNKKWRFLASFEDGKAEVQLWEVGAMHPAYPLEGTNNIILITTERYKTNPMVIRGYGAGAQVTAAGIFADVIRVANV